MDRLKTFFKYLILVIAFYIFSQVIIYFCIQTSYENIPFEDIAEEYTITGEAKSQRMAGIVKCVVINSSDEVLTNKYIKVYCYSKNEVVLGTEYIEIDKIEAKDKKEFEINFKYENVKSVKVDIVDEINERNY